MTISGKFLTVSLLLAGLFGQLDAQAKGIKIRSGGYTSGAAAGATQSANGEPTDPAEAERRAAAAERKAEADALQAQERKERRAEEANEARERGNARLLAMKTDREAKAGGAAAKKGTPTTALSPADSTPSQASALSALNAQALKTAQPVLIGSTPVYRVVDGKGRVTFTDRVPNDPSIKVTNGTGRALSTDASTDTSGLDKLSPELRAIASRFPVTLYTGPNCGPCQLSRSTLNARGIPFTEKTVANQQDVASLLRVTGDTTLPIMTVGGQRIRGFVEEEYAQFLDAAEYPAKSALPPGYRNPPATPLVAATSAAAAGGADGASPQGAGGTTVTGANGETLTVASTRTSRAAPSDADRARARADAEARRNNPTGIAF